MYTHECAVQNCAYKGIKCWVVICNHGNHGNYLPESAMQTCAYLGQPFTHGVSGKEEAAITANTSAYVYLWTCKNTNSILKLNSLILSSFLLINQYQINSANTYGCNINIKHMKSYAISHDIKYNSKSAAIICKGKFNAFGTYGYLSKLKYVLDKWLQLAESQCRYLSYGFGWF